LVLLSKSAQLVGLAAPLRRYCRVNHQAVAPCFQPHEGQSAPELKACAAIGSSKTSSARHMT